jgi:phosphoglycolate phosphatase-like HAD superfamily hydrolase
MIKLFIFDWDGTLWESPKIFHYFSEFQKKFRKQKKLSEKEKKEILERLKKQKIFLQRKRSIESFIYSIIMLIFHEHPKKGSIELINFLKERGKKVAIFTDARKERVLLALKKYNIKVDYLVTTREIKNFKPSNIGIELLLFATNTKRKETLMVGDSKEDMLAAKASRIKSIAICDGFGKEEELKLLSDFSFKNLYSFYTWLKRKNSLNI